MKGGNKPFVYGILIVLVALAVGSGAAYYDSRNSSKVRLECIRAGKEVRVRFGLAECVESRSKLLEKLEVKQ